MQPITSKADLKRAISQLEEKQAADWLLLHEQIKSTYESFKPLNIIKSTLKDAASSLGIKDKILGAGMGITVGYLSKALITNAVGGPIKRILGTLLEVGISTIISHNPEAIKMASDKIFSFFSTKKTPQTEPDDEHTA